jgi:putative ABC transport system permease protein
MTPIRLAFRQLARAPGFTAVAVLTVALGIGACAAIFTVVNGVLLRPLPFPGVARMVLVNESAPHQPATTVATGKYAAWKAQVESFEDLGAMAGQSYNLTGAGEPVHLVGGRITASMLTTLGVAPALGRNFETAEERPFGQESAVLLGHELWQTRFGGRPEVVGSTIQLSGRPFTVVGVMPRETGLPSRVQLFTPLGLTAAERNNYGQPFLHVIGRLAPGVPIAAARSEMSVVIERIAAAAGRPSPKATGWSVRVTPLVDSIVGNVRPVLLSLLGAVGFLLLIACTNVASLLLARGTARATELAVRAALGASRARIVRQLLVESLALAILGGGLGLLFAHGGLAGLLALAPETLPRAAEIGLDGRALAVTAAVALLSALVFGVLPAVQASRVSLGEGLKQAVRGSTPGAARQRLRRGLVSAQVAIALVLLAGAGLLMRSFANLQQVDPGFDLRGAYVAETFLPRPQYTTAQQYITFARNTLDELAAVPGIEAVAVANNLPFSKHHATYAMMARLSVPGRAPSGAADDLIMASESSISPDYFRAMGIPLLRGRTFDGRDVASGALAVIVSDSVARRLFPGQDALGKEIVLHGGGPPRLIVGIAGNVKQASLEAEASLQVYQPFAQLPDNDMLFVVRATRLAGGDARVLSAMRAAITRSDGNVPVFAAQTLAGSTGASIARQRFSLTLFGLFSAVAVLLAAIGLYGVMAYAVTQRTGEIGIRMALGARAGSIARLVLSEGGRVVALGVVAGLAGASLLTGLMQRMLFAVSAHDPLTFISVALLMTAAAVPACLVPALKAARLDPMIALRRQ